MIQITDNTLTAFDNRLPSKEDLHTFCELLFLIGVDIIELSKAAYMKMEQLPKGGKYILDIDYLEEMERYPGFYLYSCHDNENTEKVMNELQMNDVREIVKLRALKNCKELRIVGLDDILCESYDNTMKEIQRILPQSKINFCPENTYGCASALAVQWILNNGKYITTSYAGYKNNAATEEVIMALRLIIRHKPNRDLTVLPSASHLFEKITNKVIGNKKPVIGKNIFKVEAGIHADGLKKNPMTYEPYEPECVGGKSEIIIGKHSGKRAVIFKLEEMKIPVPQEIIINKILHLIKDICIENRRSLRDEEFASIVNEVIAYESKQIYR